MINWLKCLAVAVLVALPNGASAIQILVGTWGGNSNSGDNSELCNAQWAIDAYNSSHNPDLPALATINPGKKPKATLLLDVHVPKTQVPNGEHTFNWTADPQFSFYYVLTKWGNGGSGTDTALHYITAGEVLSFDPTFGNGLSHYCIWRGPANVPEGGSTLILLGAGLGLLAVGRRVVKR
jgi:hypothetical protein